VTDALCDSRYGDRVNLVSALRASDAAVGKDFAAANANALALQSAEHAVYQTHFLDWAQPAGRLRGRC
jgi:hypothetical protein